MKYFYKLPYTADVNSLLLAIHRYDKSQGIWQADTYLRDYPQGPFGHTESIILRFPPRSVHETEEALKDHNQTIDEHENVDQPVFAFLPEARPLIFGLMAATQGERLGRCMINKLQPDGVIYPHADTPTHAAYWDRFHVVLQSNGSATFRCADETVFMMSGEVWWFNNAKEHEVINHGDDDRIHMIVDIRTRK